MPSFQYQKVPVKDLDKYPGWEILTTTTERSTKFYCERSQLSLDKCEDVECARLGTHRTKTKVEDVEFATIRKADNKKHG